MISLALVALLMGVSGAWSQCADGEYNGSYFDSVIGGASTHIGFRLESDGTVVSAISVDFLGCDATRPIQNVSGTGTLANGNISISAVRLDGLVHLDFMGYCTDQGFNGTWTGTLPDPSLSGATCTGMGTWSAARTPTGDDDDGDDDDGGGDDDDGGAGDDDGDDDDDGGDDDDGTGTGADDSRRKNRASSGASNPVVEMPLGIDFDINPSFFDLAALEAMNRIDPKKVAAVATMRLVWSNNRIRKELIEDFKKEVEENLQMEVGGNRPSLSSERPWRMVERMRTWKRDLSSQEVMDMGMGRQEVTIGLDNSDRSWNFSRGRSIQVETDPILVSQAHQTPPPRRKLFNRGLKQGIVQ